MHDSSLHKVRLIALFFAVLTFLALNLEDVRAAEQQGFKNLCKELLLYSLNDPAYFQERAQHILPKVFPEMRSYWAKDPPKPEDSAYHARANDAVKWLEDLKSKKISTSILEVFATNQAWGNSIFRFRERGFSAVIKENKRRVSIDSDRVVSIQNNIRYERVAFLLDRLLGFNKVIPTVILDSNKSASLFMPNIQTISLHSASQNLSLLEQMTLITVLDTMLQNNDRREYLLTKNGELYAFDFDLSQAGTRYSGYNSLRTFLVERVKVENSETKLKKFSFPGVIKQKHYQALKNLTEESLKSISDNLTQPLTQNELNSILGGRSYWLKSFDKWIEQYGHDQIILL